MSLRSEERQLRRDHRKLLKQRRRAIERGNRTWAARRGREARRLWQKIISIHRRRVGTFRPSMLDGNAGNVADQVKRFIALAYKFADEKGYVCTVTSTTGGTHSPTSLHYHKPLGWAVDLIFATVAQMEEFQQYAADHTGNGEQDFLELFGPAPWYVKSGQRVAGHFPDHGDHVHGAPTEDYRTG